MNTCLGDSDHKLSSLFTLTEIYGSRYTVYVYIYTIIIDIDYNHQEYRTPVIFTNTLGKVNMDIIVFLCIYQHLTCANALMEARYVY